MAKNLYISDKVKSEQELYENIVIESLKIYQPPHHHKDRQV